jgi:hypothetical protein
MSNHPEQSSEASPARRDHAEDIAQALVTEGGYLSIGRYGFTLHFGAGVMLSGYDCDGIKAECIAAGLPIIDSRQAPFEKLVRVVLRGPIVAVGRAPDPEPYHALSFAPLAYVAELYRSIGADVRNLPAGRDAAGTEKPQG